MQTLPFSHYLEQRIEKNPWFLERDYIELPENLRAVELWDTPKGVKVFEWLESELYSTANFLWSLWKHYEHSQEKALVLSLFDVKDTIPPDPNYYGFDARRRKPACTVYILNNGDCNRRIVRGVIPDNDLYEDLKGKDIELSDTANTYSAYGWEYSGFGLDAPDFIPVEGFTHKLDGYFRTICTANRKRQRV